jgi:uncharacterized protein YaeQ
MGDAIRNQEANVQKRETRITIESHQVMILRRSNDAIQVWCERCGDRVRMVTAEQAGIISGSTLRLVLRQVEADAVHFSETSEGRLFICLNSLIGGNATSGIEHTLQ